MSVPTPISSGKSGKANWGFFGRQGGISKKPYDSLSAVKPDQHRIKKLDFIS